MIRQVEGDTLFSGLAAVRSGHLGERFTRPRDVLLFGAISLIFLGIAVDQAVISATAAVPILGNDFHLNLDATSRWLAGGPVYPANELAGPFFETGGNILYPPTTLLVFAPFALIPVPLAAVLWWGLPLAALVWQVWRFRPRPLVWPLLAICIAWPATLLTIVVGNPSMLFIGLLALGTMYSWPAVLILLKPSVFPFALWGINRRSWWIALAICVGLSIPFGLLWLDWLTVLGNSRIGGALHSVQQVPLFLFPLIVWLGRSQGSTALPSQPD